MKRSFIGLVLATVIAFPFGASVQCEAGSACKGISASAIGIAKPRLGDLESTRRLSPKWKISG